MKQPYEARPRALLLAVLIKRKGKIAAVEVTGATSKMNVSQLYSAKKVEGKIKFKDDGDRQSAMP